MQKEHKKRTTSLMIWSHKLAQQTAQLTTRKSIKKTTTFRLKKYNFPAQKFTTAAPPQIPRLSWTCSQLGPASQAWSWILLEGRATRVASSGTR